MRSIPFTRSRSLTRVARRCLPICVLLPFLLCSCGDGPSSPERLPNRLVQAIQSVSRPTFIASVDLNGDGVDEELKMAESPGGALYMTAARVREDRHYALWTRNFFNKANICGLADIDGDGADEVVWWEQLSPDSVRVVISPLSDAARPTMDSALGVIGAHLSGEPMPDGRWGGDVFLLGSFDEDDDGDSDVLALGMNTGVCLEPRGVWFWDLETNRFTARVSTAATVTGGVAVLDLDGDGREELVLGLESPGNGVVAEPWDDRHCYVVVFSSRGEVLWSRELGGNSSSVGLVALDLDGDGVIEVATVVGTHSEETPESLRLAVWSGDEGRELGALSFDCSINDLASAATAEGPRLFVAASDGIARRVRWDGMNLAIEEETDCGDGLETIGIVPMGPSPGSARVAVGTVKGRVIVLDLDLSPMAALELDEPFNQSGTLRPLTVPSDRGPVDALLAMTEDTVFRLALERRPPSLLLWTLLGIAGAAAAVGAAPATRRPLLALARRAVVPAEQREEVLDGLSKTLTVASHGRLSVTSTLRRLHEQLVMLYSLDESPPDSFGGRFRDAVENALDVGIPGILAVTRSAERIGIASGAEAGLRSRLERLGDELRSRRATLPSPEECDRLAAVLAGLLSDVEQALRRIRTEVERELSCTLVREVDRAVDACRSDAAALGADIDVTGRDTLAGARVSGTPRELAFILENLLSNAIAAVGDAERRHIRVALSREDGFAVVAVHDTGSGIPTETRDRIFTAGVSGTGSTGQGLHMSSELASRRGGSIRLLDTRAGEGSVFEVRFRTSPLRDARPGPSG